MIAPCYMQAKGSYYACRRLMLASEQKAEAKRAEGDERAEDTGR